MFPDGHSETRRAPASPGPPGWPPARPRAGGRGPWGEGAAPPRRPANEGCWPKAAVCGESDRTAWQAPETPAAARGGPSGPSRARPASAGSPICYTATLLRVYTCWTAVLVNGQLRQEPVNSGTRSTISWTGRLSLVTSCRRAGRGTRLALDEPPTLETCMHLYGQAPMPGT